MENIWADHAARLGAMRFPDALGAGTTAPDFVLPNARGVPTLLSTLLDRAPVVLVFLPRRVVPVLQHAAARLASGA
jgi:peroxiredoxin